MKPAFSKVINVSVPAALRTAFLLFRPDVAQRASKIISTIINSKILPRFDSFSGGKLNFPPSSPSDSNPMAPDPTGVLHTSRYFSVTRLLNYFLNIKTSS